LSLLSAEAIGLRAHFLMWRGMTAIMNKYVKETVKEGNLERKNRRDVPGSAPQTGCFSRPHRGGEPFKLPPD
jgi:hypothetical protein